MAFLRKQLLHMKKNALILIGYLTLLLEALSGVIAIIYLGKLLNIVFRQGHMDRLANLLTMYAIFFFLPRLLFTLRKVIFFNVSYQLQDLLLEEFLIHIYDFSEDKVTKVGNARILNHLRKDLADVYDLWVNHQLSGRIKNLVSVLSIAFVLFISNKILLVTVLCFSILYYSLLRRFGQGLRSCNQDIRSSKGGVSAVVEECISSLREVIAFGRKHWQMRHYEESYKEYYQNLLRESWMQIRIIVIGEPFLYGTKLVVILLGTYEIIKGQWSLGDFVSAYAFVTLFVDELGQFFQEWVLGKQAEASWDALSWMIEEKKAACGELKLDCPIEKLEFEKVSFAYEDKEAPLLNNISLQIPIGKKIAIVGKSGCGKSTMAKLMIGQEKPTGGRIKINGHALDEYESMAYGEKIAMVFQETYFLPSTIQENLCLGQDYSQKKIDHLCEQLSCKKFLQDMPKAYETELGERGVKLSGGQKQRLALVKSLLRDPEILILDESTSALDLATEKSVQESIDRMRQGKTTIIIAHRLSTIQDSDLILVMDEGKILDTGRHEALMKSNKTYKKLYEGERKVYCDNV